MISKTTFITLLAFLMIGLTSCKDESKKEEDTKIETTSQMKQVMAIHDEVMPKMSKVGQLVGKLKPMADSLGMESPQGKAMKDLQEANMTMMDWMQGFGNRFDSDEIMDGKELSEEKKKWLNEEETKVKEVKEKINSSIANAESLLDSLE
jgi:DNA-directed RNA polymerase beta' subunit